MKYFIMHHQHKGKAIDSALRKAGWRYQMRRVDIALFDHVINRSEPEQGRGLVKRYYDEGATIVTYPHGTTGAWFMDSDVYPKDKRVTANLVISEGQKKVEEIIQPQLEHHVIGWSYCGLREWKKPEKVRRILFAPIHSPIKGKFREECVDVNARVYKALLGLADRYQIVVRHLNPLDKIGLWYSPKPVFKLGKPDGSHDEIDIADLVIAEGTFMYLAVARGKPVIGMNQHVPIRPNYSDKSFKLNNWDKYGEYMAYPIDFDDGDIIELINKASEKEQSEWRKLFIGDTMQPVHLVSVLESIRGKDARVHRSK